MKWHAEKLLAFKMNH